MSKEIITPSPPPKINKEEEYKRNSGSKAIFASSIGNAMEYYNFSVYAFFAIYIAHNFFPSQGGDNLGLFETFIAFGIGFIIRPLGGVIIGIYGDSVGRKAALVLTIMTMGIGTAIIAFAPTYIMIGIGAPILILLGRLMQGFSAGGNMGGAATFLIEHAPADKKGHYASWIQASIGMSNIIAALVASAVTLILTHDQITSWGWRIPFILGLTIIPIGFWMRKTLSESPLFHEQKKQRQCENKKTKINLLHILRIYRRSFIIGTGLSILWTVSVYSLIVYLPIYVQDIMHYESKHAFLASLVGNVFMVAFCLLSGKISDHIGTTKVLVLSSIILLVGTYPLFMLLSYYHSVAVLYLVQTLLCIMASIYVGIAPAVLASLFPTEVRATGMSICYNLAVTIFGGFAPAILSWLSMSTQLRFSPAWYVMLSSIIALISLFFMYKHKKDKADFIQQL